MDERPPPLLHPSVRALTVPPPTPEGPAGGVSHLEAHVARLERALASRSSVDQAQGILMHRFAVDAKAALDLLTQWATVTDLQLAELARVMVQLAGGGDQAEAFPGAVESQVSRLMREGSPTSTMPVVGPRSVTPE